MNHVCEKNKFIRALQCCCFIPAAGGNVVDVLFRIAVLDVTEGGINFKMSHNILLDNSKTLEFIWGKCIRFCKSLTMALCHTYSVYGLTIQGVTGGTDQT